jgi:hypothetical protein
MTHPQQADPTIAAWRAAAERGDPRSAIDCLAEDVELISPITGQFTFQGRAQVGQVVRAAFKVISGIRFHTEVGDGATRALFYRGRCAGQVMEEAQLLRLDTDGRICALTLFSRPLPGVTAVMREIGPELARMRGRPALAVILQAATLPLHAMTVTGERRVAPLADPHRS